MKLSRAVALRLTNILREKKMSLYKLEKIIAMPHNTMKTIMGERNSGVNLRTVALIVRGLDMSLSEFFADPIFDNMNLNID